jgi:DNA repair protein RadC
MTDVIADLPVDDRPRERLLKHGAATLSNAELLAILLGSGVTGKNAIQLARELLKGGLDSFRGQDVMQLEKIPGIGPAKLTRIAAAVAFSRRIFDHEPDDPPSYDRTVLGRALLTHYAHQRQERLGGVFLDSRHRILRDERDIYVGTINNALVSTRDILNLAIVATNATGIVIYHNHPSGGIAPSAEDITFTDKLAHSLKLVDIELVDHLIIGAHAYYSMKERGYL